MTRTVLLSIFLDFSFALNKSQNIFCNLTLVYLRSNRLLLLTDCQKNSHLKIVLPPSVNALYLLTSDIVLPGARLANLTKASFNRTSSLEDSGASVICKFVIT